MEYFNLLEFKKEPFSNSPEPEFFFASEQQNTCLQRLELAVRLRRGLNIIMGAVGTGKTTLCRKLIQNLSLPVKDDREEIKTYLLMDPAVASKLDFVTAVASILGIKDISSGDNEWQIKEKIKTFLFEQGVEEQKNIVLVIDEGQKIPDPCLEILREFLNYETNSFKLLQIVIFAQPEFRLSLAASANLLDRVNYLCHLKPLTFRQTKAMIAHRVSIASMDPSRSRLFTPGGILAVYFATSGYPRKIVSLCHQVILMMIIRGKNQAGWLLVRNCVNKISGQGGKRLAWAALGILLLLVAGALMLFRGYELFYMSRQINNQPVLSGVNLHKENIAPQQAPGGQMKTRLPEVLGAIALKKGMTIWRVFEHIYGDTGKSITAQFMEANPEIKNINEIVEGTVIQLPASPAAGSSIKLDAVFVSIQESGDLESLYKTFVEKAGRKSMPSLMFLSAWNQKNGRQFAIILDQSFRTIEEAEAAIRQLPQELSISARLLNRWEDGTIFFNRRGFRSSGRLQKERLDEG